MSKVLVTGGAGFIGSNIADLLIENGFEVSIIDNLSTGVEKNLNPKAKFFNLDILDPKISEVFKENKFDFVVHQAAQIDVRKSVADPIADAKTNILGSLNILENSRLNGVKKILFASTGGAIYGDANIIPTSEDYPPMPASPYGIAKFAIENYLRFYNQVYGLSYIALRYANVYGPGQNPHGEAGVVAILVDRMLSGREFVINGDGKQTRDFVYVGDVARANLLALKSDKIGSFNVGTSKETDVNLVFDVLNNLTGGQTKESHGPAKVGEQMRSCVSFEKIKKELGWEPKVSLDEGLKKTVEYFQKK